ncbi:MAG TPA: DUF2332 domain-containing protein [Candidatus Dormibacteraeota bacterium]|nr:DUF2332 domain-containing protein [Candidatus Dormibacteraeota bacterium]
MRTARESSRLHAAVETLANRLRWQGAGCKVLGSPFYASLLESAVVDLEAGGPTWSVLEGFEAEPRESAVALRLLAPVHRKVLTGELPELGRHYPSIGGDGDATAAWPYFREFVAGNEAWMREELKRPCQTNEVGRSAALFGGFLEVAHRTGKPLRILELGASAGLNLRWDRYCYASGDGSWGDESSPVRFANSFDVAPPMNRTADVVERKGCDLNPIDATSDDGALTLRSFVWADQLARLTQLDGAIEVARQMPVDVERIGAGDFLERELFAPRPDVATVVYHSVFIQYVTESEKTRIAGAIAAGDAFYLRMEPAYPLFEVRLDDELLGTSHAHGTHVRWNLDSNS